jgi:hypothetical protein
VQLGFATTGPLYGDCHITEDAVIAAEDAGIGALGPPCDAKCSIIDGQPGIAHRHLREIAEPSVPVGWCGKIVQQVVRPVAGARLILAQADMEGAVPGALEMQVRLPQDDARRRDHAMQRRAQAEPERQLRQRQLRLAVMAPEAHAARHDVDSPALLQAHQGVIDMRRQPGLGAGDGIGDIGAEEVERQRPARQAPDKNGDQQR